MSPKPPLSFFVALASLPLLFTACGVSNHPKGGDEQALPKSGEGANCTRAASGGGSSVAPDIDSSSEIEGPRPLAIEEADLVKLSGETLFVHNEERGLQIVDISDATTPSLAATVPEVAGEAGELYVHEGHVLVMLGEEEDGCSLPKDIDSRTVSERHRLSAVALDSEAGPELAADLCLPGHVVGSRLIENTMYVVSTLDQGDTSLTWVISIDVSAPSAATIVSHSVATGLAHEVHVTEKAIYVVHGVDSEGKSVDAQLATNTQLRYFDIENADSTVKQRGKIELPGAPQGRFHLDEYMNTFRVVTFLGRQAGSSLYVVDISVPDSLTLKSELSNIAPGEDLHATRFVADNVYIVTYEAVILRTDPLWVVSLEDPERPVIQGHLEVPGFSSYLYPRGDTLLAIGRGDNGNKVAASLFDVGDPTLPRELTRLEFGEALAFTEGNLDFRGITVIEEPGDGDPALLAVPTTHQRPLAGGSCDQENSLTLIDVHADTLTLRGSLSLTHRVQRSFDHDDLLLAVGRRFIGSVDYTRRDAPQQIGGLMLGDAKAPIECIPFEEIYGNSTDATIWGGTRWVGGDIWWNEDTRTNFAGTSVDCP